MSWERHPKHANAGWWRYEACGTAPPGREREEVEALVKSLREEKEARFERLNMIEYKTLELHAYYCRYAYEEIGKRPRKGATVWSVIEKVILATGEDITLEDMTEEEGISPETLNRRMKEACDLPFFQLKQFGKVINACALLHSFGIVHGIYQ